MFNDVKILRDNRYSQANELHRRCTSAVVVVVEMLLLLEVVVIIVNRMIFGCCGCYL